MCTVSVIPTEQGLRLLCNRDERTTRPDALPPMVCRVGDGRAILPIDVPGGGTWIAVNTAGVIFALLNVNSGPADTTDTITREPSRGLLIPPLLGLTSADAVAHAGRLLIARHAPCRLLVADVTSRHEVYWDGHSVQRHEHDPRAALVLSSSSLGDELVATPRRELFEELLSRYPDDPRRAQDVFHRHRWHDRPHLSVMMSRHDARTVSVTAAEVSDDEVSLVYCPTARGAIEWHVVLGTRQLVSSNA